MLGKDGGNEKDASYSYMLKINENGYMSKGSNSDMDMKYASLLTGAFS